MTKREALEKCKDQWTWIAEQIRNGEPAGSLTVHRLKGRYCADEDVDNNCYLCEFDLRNREDGQPAFCDADCLVKWAGGGCMSDVSEFRLVDMCPTPENALAIVALCDAALAELEGE